MQRLRTIWNRARTMTVIFAASSVLFTITAWPLMGPDTGSYIGWRLTKQFVTYGWANQPPAHQLHFIDEGDAFVLVDGGDPRMMSQPSCYVAFRHDDWESSGLWAPTFAERWGYGGTIPLHGTWSDERKRAAVKHAVALIDPATSPFTADELRTLANGKGSFSYERVLWFGYVHNAASLMLFMLLSVSLVRGVVVSRREARIRRNAAFALAGVCHRCRYSRVGLSVDAPCPECGVPGFRHPSIARSAANGSADTQSSAAVVDDAPTEPAPAANAPAARTPSDATP